MFPYPIGFNTSAAAGLADIDNVYSMEFDGVDDYMTTGINLGYTNYPNLSLSCWIKVDVSALADFTTYTPVGVYTGSYPNSTPIAITHQNHVASPRVMVSVQGSGTVYSTTELGDGNWHHIVQTCEYDASGTICNVYVDGNPTPEIVNKLLLSFAPLTRDLILGGALTTWRLFLGSVDEVAAFDYILSTDDITDIYNATSSGKTADLSSMSTPPLAWYRMGD